MAEKRAEAEVLLYQKVVEQINSSCSPEHIANRKS